MERVIKWFERKFEASMPLELLPNLMARLRGTPARLEDLLRPMSREVLTRRTNEKWSAQEQAGHLLDLEPLWMARVEDYAADRAELTVADLSNRKTQEADHNAQSLASVLSEFRSARDKLLARVEESDRLVFTRSLPHPRLKTPMQLMDHLYFVAEHDDHHLARIWELVSN